MDTTELEELNKGKGQRHQGVDTRDLVYELKGLSISEASGGVLAGKGRESIEAGAGDIKGRWEEIPRGWEMIWVQDPWMGKWEQVKVPHEEAERCRRQGLQTRPSYSGETEAKEWRRRLREEREAMARELENKKAWHLVELQKMGVYPDHGWPVQEKVPRSGGGAEMRRPYHS